MSKIKEIIVSLKKVVEYHDGSFEYFDVNQCDPFAKADHEEMSNAAKEAINFIEESITASQGDRHE